MMIAPEFQNSCRRLKQQLRSSTVLPAVMGLGVAATGLGIGLCVVRPAKAAPAASAVLPDAVSRDAPAYGVHTVACSPCGACTPCAAANPCSPCNPCAAGGGGAGATDCVVPRLAAANPCNPCAAGGAAEITDAEAAEVYDCVKEAMQAAYGVADDPIASEYPVSYTHLTLPTTRRV